MGDPEIITLSSDEDTKPLVRMQFSKRKRGKGDVNPTASKKIALQFQASCSSNTQNVQNRHQFHPKSSVMSKNETRTVVLPVYKHQNVTQNGNIHNQRFSSKLPSSSSLNKYQNTTQNGNIHNQHFSSKLSSSSSQQKYKDGKSSYVPEKLLGNTKFVHHLQNKYKSNTVSNSFHTLRSSTPKNSVMNVKISRTNVSVIQKSNGMQSENSSNKMNIPLSVLSALREKGISITNVDEKPKSNVVVCNKQLESQKFLNKLKSSLSKSNTNINVVPKANTVPSFSTFPKANGISHSNVHGFKNTVKGSSCNLNKYQNEKKVVLPSTQSVPNKYTKNVPFKFSSEIKIIEKPATVTKSVTVTNEKKFVHNSAQKDLLCFPKPSSAGSRLTIKDSTSGSSFQLPSRHVSITPIAKPKNNFAKPIFLPEINIVKVDNSKQTKKATTPCFTSVPTSNSAVSTRTVNSSVKNALNTNNKKPSPAVTKKSSLKSNTKKYKPCVTKNVDLLNGRDTLLTLLSLCDNNEEESPSYIIPATYTSNSELAILPVTSKSSVCHSETKAISRLIKSMKLKHVASETHNWPRLIVSLERLDIHKICTKEKISVPQTVTEAFDLSQMDNKYSKQQKLEEFCKKISADYHSVKSDDDHLSTSISGGKTESSVALKNSNTCISVPKTVTGTFDLSETDDKYSNVQELEEFYEKISADDHSVKSNDDDLSTSISCDKTESSVALKNSIDTLISVPETVSEADNKYSNEQEFCEKTSADYHSVKSEDDHLPASISSDKTESSAVLMNSIDTYISVPESVTRVSDSSEMDKKYSKQQKLEEFCEKISADYHSVKSDDDHSSTSIPGDKTESSVALKNSKTFISAPETVTGAFDLPETGDKYSNEQELKQFCKKISVDHHSAKSEDHLSISISGDKSESSVALKNSIDTRISVPESVTGVSDSFEMDNKYSKEQTFEEFEKISADYHSVKSDEDHSSTSISGDKTESSVALKNSKTCISAPETVTGAFDLSETAYKYSNEQELKQFCKKKSVDHHSAKSEDHLSTSISGDKSESSVVLMNSADTFISVPKTVTGSFDLSETIDKHSNEQELEEVCEKISVDCHSVISENDHLSTSISGDKSESSVVLMNSIDAHISVTKTVNGAFDLSETDDKHSNEQELEEFCENISVDHHSVKSDHLSSSISGDKSESSVVLVNSIDTHISVPEIVSETFDLSEADNKYSKEHELEEFCEKMSADYHSVKSGDDHLSTSISGNKTEASLVLTNSMSTCFSDDVRDKNSVENLKISRESVCTISNTLKANTVTETVDSSSHLASLDSLMTFKTDNNIFDTVDSLHAIDPSQCIKRLITGSSSKNSDNLLANPNSNDIFKAKSILQSDIENYFIPNYDVSNSNEVRNLLNSIIFKICNMQLKEVQNTCMEVLNTIISTIENLSDSLLTETEIVTNIQSACQESIKHATTEKPCNLLSDNAYEDIIEKSSTAVHPAVDNNHCVEIYKENKERKSLTFHVPSNIEEKSSDSLTVPNKLFEETNISMSVDESINICDRTDANTNSDVNKSIPSKDSPKEIVNKINFNLTAEKSKCQEDEIICDESDFKIITDNTENLSFNYDVIEQKVDSSEISESLNSDNEMDFTISNEITVDEYNQMKSSKDDACFQDDNALISVSPLRENGALSCIIVQVESRQDLFTEEEQHFEDDSEFKQNHCIIEQDNMDFNDEEPESYMTFSFAEDTSTSDKYACAYTDDEEENTLNQADSTQVTSPVTSPKLSLKRNRNIESPDGKVLADNREYFANNGLKRIKLDESVLSIGQETSSSSDKNPVPLYETLEEKNNRKFMELLEYSRTLMAVDSSEEEKDIITKIMIKKLGETPLWYAGSKKFSADIEIAMNKLRVVENSGDNVFDILKVMRHKFKNYKRSSRSCSNRENSQDTNLAFSSSVSNDFVEGSNSAFKINTDEINDFIETPSHTFLSDIHKRKTTESSVFINNTVDKRSPALEPLLSSTIESSSLKNAISDSHLNSVATSSTSEHNSLTSNSSMQLITKSNTSDKDRTNSSDLSSLKLQSLNSHEPLTVVNGITDIDMHLRQSTSKDDAYSYKDDSKTFPLDTNCSNKQPKGKVNSNLSTSLPADKKKGKTVKANSRPADDVSKSAEQIKKLEKMLKKLDKKIKQLQAKELSLDDLDDDESPYILEERYKKRFNKVWETICLIKKQSSRTGRVIDKKFKYEGSRFKAINVAVEKMINRRKAHEKFPDYVEVLTLIKQVNDFEDIGLSEKLVEIEAENVFRDIGKELQIRRCRDFDDLLGCHLTDNFDPMNDPAEHDETLRKILNENKQSFERRMNQVLDTYAERQLVTPEDENNEDNEDHSSEEDDQEEKDNDLPLTDPGSPNSDSLDSCKNDVIEIINESDKSTDPNEEIMRKKDIKTESNATEVNPTNIEKNGKIFPESIVIEDSSSSDDLPSIQDVMSSR